MSEQDTPEVIADDDLDQAQGGDLLVGNPGMRALPQIKTPNVGIDDLKNRKHGLMSAGMGGTNV